MDDTPSGGTVAAPVPANPAGAAAKAELTAIMTDPNNKMHLGWLRSDPAVKAHVNAMFNNAYPDAAPATTTPSTPLAPTPVSGLNEAAPSLEYEVAKTMEALRSESEWGAQHYEEHLSEAQVGFSSLRQKLGDQEAEDLLTACKDAGLDLKQIMKIASHYELRGRETKLKKQQGGRL